MSEPLTREEEEVSAALQLLMMHRDADTKAIHATLSDHIDTLRRELTEERERGARLAGVVEAARKMRLGPCEDDDCRTCMDGKWESICKPALIREAAALNAALSALDSDGA